MIFSELPLGIIHATGFFLFVSFMLSAMTVLRALTKQGFARFAVLPAIIAAAGVYPVIGVEGYCFALQRNREIYTFSRFIMGIPVAAVFSFTLLLFAASVFMFVHLEIIASRALSDWSIRDGLDSLSDGLLFSDEFGLPILVNKKMREICYAAFGSTVMDYGYLKRRLDRNELKKGCSVERTDSSLFLRLNDGSVWDLREASLSTKLGPVTELIAFDITEISAAADELKLRNKKLRSVNQQMREYSARIDAVVREKELLAAKIRLHDKFGQALLSIRSYLSEPGQSRQALLELLREPVFVLQKEKNEHDDDLFSLLEEAASAIGVTIECDGEPPTAKREVIEVAVHECLTNTVKHANGHTLYIKSRFSDGEWNVEFTNSGDPPKENSFETGGLIDLRRLAENNGVEMKIEWTPVFRLTLNFKEGERTSV